MKIEWVQMNKHAVPVVRLAEVEKLIQEAVKIVASFAHADGCFCESSFSGPGCHVRHSAECLQAQAFLASVAAWRKGQKEQK